MELKGDEILLHRLLGHGPYLYEHQDIQALVNRFHERTVGDYESTTKVLGNLGKEKEIEEKRHLDFQNVLSDQQRQVVVRIIGLIDGGMLNDRK